MTGKAMQHAFVCGLVVLAMSLGQSRGDDRWLAYPGTASERTPNADEQMTAESSQSSTVESPGWQKPLPLSLGIEYTLVSDYIFRGVNFSEHAAEGREKPNHQLLTSMALDLGPLWGAKPGQCGEVGFDVWFEWYPDQDKLNPNTESSIQEIDYTIWYGYDVEPLATYVKVGWLDYVFPNLGDVGNDDRTNEWFISLEHNDAWAWRWLGYQGDDGILNPTLAFYHDMHLSGGTWLDLGISHGFELAKNLTFTPSYTLHVDGGYLGPVLSPDDHDTRIAGMTYGMDLTYDLTELLQLPDWAGTMSISGFLDWFDPTGRLRRTLQVEDELYGGVKLAWSW